MDWDDNRTAYLFLLIFILVVGFIVYWVYFGSQSAAYAYNWSDLSSDDENTDVTLLSSYDGHTNVLKIRDESFSGLARLQLFFASSEYTVITFYAQFEDGHATDVQLGFYNIRGEVETWYNIEDDGFVKDIWSLVEIQINGTGNETVIVWYVNGKLEDTSTIVSAYENEFINKIQIRTAIVKKENIYIDIIEII